jgi:uncharacterized protein (DUF58 family)
LRWVDWKIYGRTDRYFLKQREEESNLVCHLVLDVSASMNYQSMATLSRQSSSSEIRLTKFELAKRWCAAIAFVALSNRDGITLTSFGETLGSTHRISMSGPAGIQAVAVALDRYAPQGPTHVAQVLPQIAQRLPRRGLLMLVSDLMDDPATIASGIRGLASSGHRIIIVQIIDPDEEELPWRGPVRLEGLENEPSIDLDAMAFRRAYREELAALRLMIAEVCREVEADFRIVRTNMNVAENVRRWLHSS